MKIERGSHFVDFLKPQQDWNVSARQVSSLEPLD